MAVTSGSPVERQEDSGADRAQGASTPGASQVIIRIRDTGIGIAADQLENVFEMFTQVDASLERSLTGLGIGLTLVKTLTEMHGGTVDVHSDGLGHGSEFIVRLPIAEGASLPVSTPTAPPAVPATPLRILIIDDNHDSADMLGMLLQFAGLGARLHAIEQPEQALDIHARRLFRNDRAPVRPHARRDTKRAI